MLAGFFAREQGRPSKNHDNTKPAGWLIAVFFFCGLARFFEREQGRPIKKRDKKAKKETA